MNHVVCVIAMSLERISLFDRSLMYSSLILRNFWSRLPLSLILVYRSIVRTGLRGSSRPSFSTDGSTMLIPPITTRWPCAIVHLFDTGDGFSPHHTHAINLHFSPSVPRLNQPWMVCLIPVSQPSSEPFTVSLISQAANHCLTAQANISSGAMIVQIIIFTRRHNPFQYPDGGTFGWTDTQAQIIVVKMQLHTILYSDRLTSTVPGAALLERTIGSASAPYWKSENTTTAYCNDMVQCNG